MFLEQITRRHDAALALRRKVVSVMQERAPMVAKDEGRNIGIRIHESERLRIVAVQKRHGIRTYAEAIRLLVKLGLEAAELIETKP